MSSIYGLAPYPIQWHEGMMLMPHHFQQNSYAFCFLTQYLSRKLNPIDWGVETIQWDTEKLAQGVLRLSHLEAIFPNKTVFFLPNPKESFLDLTLSTLEPSIKNTRIYLAIRTQNLDPLQEPKIQYTSFETFDLCDQNTQDRPIRAPLLLPDVFLTANPLDCQHGFSIPVAEITWEGGVWSLDTHYQPPIFWVSQRSYWGQKTLALCQKIRQKILYLQEKINRESFEHTETDIWVSEYENQYRYLGQSLLPLECDVTSESGLSAQDLWRKLVVFLGHWSTLSAFSPLPSAPVYRHHDCQACFEELFTQIETYMDRMTRGYFFSCFVQEDLSFSHTITANHLIEDHFILGLFLSESQTEMPLQKWSQQCVIASESSFSLVQAKRTLGAKRILKDSLTSLQIIAGNRGLFLLIPKADPCIVLGEKVIVYHPGGAPNTLEMRLYAQENNSETSL